MTKEEFRQFLRDPDICKEIFEIVKKGGKPTVPAQTVVTPQIQPRPAAQPTQPQFSSIADKLKFMYGRGNDAQTQPPAPQPVPPKVQQPTQPAQPPKPKLVVDPSKIPTPPKADKPQSFSSVADKLKFLRGHLDKVREEEQIAAEKVEEKTVAEKYTVISNRRCPICEKDTRVVKTKSRLNVEKRDIDYCVHYKDFDPYLYTVLTCEHCGFAAEEKKIFGCLAKQTERNFAGILEAKRHEVALRRGTQCRRCAVAFRAGDFVFGNDRPIQRSTGDFEFERGLDVSL